MTFRILFAVLVASMALAGCSTLSKLEATNVSPQAVAVAAQAFDAVEATAATYAAQPRCAAGESAITKLCADSAVVKKLKVAILAGRTDRDNLEAWVKANPSGGVGAAGLYSALQATVATIQALVK